MDLKKYCRGVETSEPPVRCRPAVHLPYRSGAFKRAVISRAALTREEYTDLLATPKGFTWNKGTGRTPTPRENGNNIARGKEEKDDADERVPLCYPDQRFMGDFMTDIWNVITPEYLKRLEQILITEFEMEDVEAKEFLEEQRLRSIFSKKQNRCKIDLSDRHGWVLDIANILVGKLSEYLEAMLSARRTNRVRHVADAILKGFGELTGEKCSLENPQNRVQDLQVYAADRLALWLGRVLGDCDEELCRRILKEKEEARLMSYVESESEDESSEDEPKKESDGQDEKKYSKKEGGKKPLTGKRKRQKKSIGTDKGSKEKMQQKSKSQKVIEKDNIEKRTQFEPHQEQLGTPEILENNPEEEVGVSSAPVKSTDVMSLEQPTDVKSQVDPGEEPREEPAEGKLQEEPEGERKRQEFTVGEKLQEVPEREDKTQEETVKEKLQEEPEGKGKLVEEQGENNDIGSSNPSPSG